MNIYIGSEDKEMMDRVVAEAKKRKRSICYIIKEKLRLAYGMNKNGEDDDV